jgi:hypothetical protein
MENGEGDEKNGRKERKGEERRACVRMREREERKEKGELGGGGGGGGGCCTWSYGRREEIRGNKGFDVKITKIPLPANHLKFSS